MGRKKKKYTDAAVADAATATVSIDDDNTYDHHCCKRCARKTQPKTTTSRYFPQDIIFQCLLHLPADYLHNVVRHVCREWSLIVHSRDFARRHLLLRNSTTRGVLIQRRPLSRKGFYLEIGRGGGSLDIRQFNCGIDDLICTSCNGLTVIPGNNHRGEFAVHYVANPLTKQLTALPPYSNSHLDYRCCGLAFAEGSMVYKVVRACCNWFGGRKKQIAVLTVGVDRAWRHIDITHLLVSGEEPGFSPLVTGGYVHWMVAQGDVLTLNVETEVVRRSSGPSVRTFGGNFLPGGSSLSFVSVDSSDGYYMDVWEMNCETGEWAMMLRIGKRPINHVFKGKFYDKSATPWCWLVAREVLLFSILSRQSKVVAYNVIAGEILQVFELDGELFHFIPHVMSLAWWEE